MVSLKAQTQCILKLGFFYVLQSFLITPCFQLFVAFRVQVIPYVIDHVALPGFLAYSSVCL